MYFSTRNDIHWRVLTKCWYPQLPSHCLRRCLPDRRQQPMGDVIKANKVARTHKPVL
jgi:hypothetical protein